MARNQCRHGGQLPDDGSGNGEIYRKNEPTTVENTALPSAQPRPIRQISRRGAGNPALYGETAKILLEDENTTC